MLFVAALALAFASVAQPQNFDSRSFHPVFGSSSFRQNNGGANFRFRDVPLQNSIAPHPTDPAEPVIFARDPIARGQFLPSATPPLNEGFRRPRVPAQNIGISFNTNQVVASRPAFVSFDGGVDRSDSRVTFSNKPLVNSGSNINPIPTDTPTFSNKETGTAISFGIPGISLTPSRTNRPRIPPISTPVMSTPFVSTPQEATFSSPPIPTPTIPSGPSTSTDQSSTPVFFFPRGDVPFLTNGDFIEPILPETDTECNLEHGVVFFEDKCYFALTRASCPEDHWLVISEEGVTFCEERKCPWEKIYYDGDCVDPGNLDVCPRGQILFVDMTGHADCDCDEDHFYDPNSGVCFAEHEQGPCLHGQYLEKNIAGTIQCTINPCEQDGYVYHEDSCYKKNYDGRCTANMVAILDDNSADCKFILPHSIFGIPPLSTCAQGSKRDFFGRCRAVFRVPSQVSLATLRGECPHKFVKDQRGTCRRVVELFG